MMTFTRRQTLIGAAATVAAAALPAVAMGTASKTPTVTGINWNGLPPSYRCTWW